MRLVSVRSGAGIHPGALVRDQVLDLRLEAERRAADPSAFHSMRALLGAASALELARAWVSAFGSEQEVARECVSAGTAVATERAVLTAPIPDPQLILSAGMNFHAHLREMKTPAPELPSAFIKCTGSVVGTGEFIRTPANYPDMLDFEGEFCAVIGKKCHQVRAEDAMDYVVGYTMINDVSARDWVKPVFESSGVMGPIHAWERNLLGKQFPTFCPMGPAIVTCDELPNPDDIRFQTYLNGRVMQDANTNDLVFNIAALIGYYSQFYEFVPGDVITTGSPAGVGFGRNPKVFMKPGDVVVVQQEKIGALTNTIA